MSEEHEIDLVRFYGGVCVALGLAGAMVAAVILTSGMTP